MAQLTLSFIPSRASSFSCTLAYGLNNEFFCFFGHYFEPFIQGLEQLVCFKTVLFEVLHIYQTFHFDRHIISSLSNNVYQRLCERILCSNHCIYTSQVIVWDCWFQLDIKHFWVWIALLTCLNSWYRFTRKIGSLSVLYPNLHFIIIVAPKYTGKRTWSVFSDNDSDQEYKTLYTYTSGVSSIPFQTSSNGYHQYLCFAR